MFDVMQQLNAFCWHLICLQSACRNLNFRGTAVAKLETRADERKGKTEGKRKKRGKPGLELWKVVIDVM